jgi:hypothetical protein
MIFEINDYSDFRNFIEYNELSKKDIDTVINKTLGVFVVGTLPKDELLICLDDFYNKFVKNKGNAERPIFLNLNIDIMD